MKLTRLILRRPISVCMVILVIVVFGVSSMRGMKQELTPEMNLSMQAVMTTCSGTNPEDVSRLVTEPVEDAVSSLSGVSSVTSYSSEGSSLVLLSYDYGTDMDEAYNDLSKKLSMLSAQLPDSAGTPTVLQMDMNSSASMTLSVSGDPAGGLYNYVSGTLQPKLERLDSVSDVSVMGGEERYISISLDREAMQQYGLRMTDIASAISQADFTQPAGSAEMGELELSVTSGQRYTRVDALGSIPISLSSGGVIELADVAQVRYAAQEQSSISRYDGEDTISLSVSRSQSATAGEVSAAVHRVLRTLDTEADGVTVTVEDDDADSISTAIRSVFVTLLEAIVISMVILYLFLGDVRASLIVASSMPVSCLAALIFMKLFGLTLNIITLCALVIGIGMMVDNSIVVLESCFRARSEGKGLFDAAVAGAKDVTLSVVASTVTTCVVFLPLAFTTGMVGQLFRPLGFVICFAMAASLLSALTIVPLTYYKYHPTERQKAPLSRAMVWLTARYEALLRQILHRRRAVFGITAFLLVLSLLAATQLGSSLMADTDDGTISIAVSVRPGTTLEGVESRLAPIEAVITGCEDVEHYSLTAGSASGARGMTSGSAAANYTVYLRDDRRSSTAELIAQWKQALADCSDCDIEISNDSYTSSMSSAVGTLEFRLTGSSYDALKQASDDLTTLLTRRADVSRVSSLLSGAAPVVHIEYDSRLCASYGLTPAAAASEVNQLLSGVDAGQITEGGTEYSILVEYAGKPYRTIDQIENLQLSAAGGSVTLGDIASVALEDSADTVTREDGSYVATVSAEAADGSAQSADAIRAAAESVTLPDGVAFAKNSSDQSMQDEFSSLYKALAIAVFLVFAVMAMQFESLRSSLMVMVTIPFCFVGSILVVYLLGASIDMTSLLGFLMLIGTVVNNGILYVDTANQLRQTLPLDEALIHAGVIRLRPILMTSLTTILGMLPLAIGSGDSADMLKGFAVVAMSGLTASTLMSLLLLPTFYLSIRKKDKRKNQPKPEKGDCLPQQA